MNYTQSLSYIKNIEKAGTDLGIERMRELLILLDEPDKSLNFVHIAGTNGKGSVSCFMTSILCESGLKVGTYNSPSVFEYNERFLIDGKSISNDDVAKYMTLIKSTIENEQKIRSAFGLGEFKPTAFEIETALFFLCCFDNECDICVLETGLGGRWDATNVIQNKELAVITKIGIDHQEYLGNSIEEIASEKSAIIMDKAVTLNQDSKVVRQIENPFNIKNGKKVFRNVKVEIAQEPKLIKSDLKGQTFEINGNQYFIKMLGNHQIENASLAVCAINNLNSTKYDIRQKAILDGLSKAKWRARFEIVEDANEFGFKIPKEKQLIFDGSHNPQGAKTLVDGIKKYFPNKKVHLVFGIFKDKEYKKVIKILSEIATKATAVKSCSPRALAPETIKQIFEKNEVECDTNQDVKQSVQNALKGDCDVIVLCGSLSLFENLK